MKSQRMRTIASRAVTVMVEGGTVMVGGAKVVKTDIGSSNGVHVVDSLILPK